MVQQQWTADELDLGIAVHTVGACKKTWEVCGSHSSFSYHMYLNPDYELAFKGVWVELQKLKVLGEQEQRRERQRKEARRKRAWLREHTREA